MAAPSGHSLAALSREMLLIRADVQEVLQLLKYPAAESDHRATVVPDANRGSMNTVNTVLTGDPSSRGSLNPPLHGDHNLLYIRHSYGAALNGLSDPLRKNSAASIASAMTPNKTGFTMQTAPTGTTFTVGASTAPGVSGIGRQNVSIVGQTGGLGSLPTSILRQDSPQSPGQRPSLVYLHASDNHLKYNTDSSDEQTTERAEHSRTNGASAMHTDSLFSGLPQGWPASVKMRKGLESTEVTKEKERDMHTRVTREANMRRLNTTAHIKVRGGGRKSTGMTARTSTIMSAALDPDSRCLLYRDLFGCLVLCWDMVVAPFLLAFSAPVHTSVAVLLMFSFTYWATDMLLAFRTGFYYRGHLQMQPSLVAKHYLKTKFPTDAVLMVFDLAAAIVAAARPRMTYGRERFVLVPKLLRLNRFFYFSKRVFRALEVLLPFGQTAVRLMSLLSQVIMGTLVFAHFMTCAWYGLGSGGPSDTGFRWLDVGDPVSQEVVTPRSSSGNLAAQAYNDMPFSYLTAFHWSLAQITLGAMEVMPTNSYERLLSIFLLLFGLIFGSVVVSLVSSQTMEYVMLRREQTQKITVLRTFLKQHGVDSKLAARVTRQVTSRLSDHSVPLSDQDVPALSMLTIGLRTELLRETRLPWLTSHPLFRTWADLDKNALEALCDEAVRFVSYVPQDVIFIPKTTATEAFLVVHGTLRYSQDSETSLEVHDMTMDVKSGAWVCEAGLWTHWTHVGKLEAEGASQLLQLSAKDVLQILNRYAAVAYVTRYYGRNYHIRIISAVPPHAPWPNDLQVPFTDPSDLLTADVGITLLEQARKNGLLEDMSIETFQKLTQEVQDEVCAIQQGEEDDIQRIVALVAFRVFSVASRLLVQLGKMDDGKAPKASCQLPGTKRSRGEMPVQAMEKVVNTLLKDFKSILQVDCSEEQVEVVESESYGIETKYLKTVYTAHLEGELKEDQCLNFPIMDHTFPKESNSIVESDRYKDLVENEVFIIKEKKKRLLFAWLPSDDFDYLKSDFGHATLVEWLKNLELVEHEEAQDGVKMILNDATRSKRVSTSRAISHSQAISGSAPVAGDFPMREMASAFASNAGSEVSPMSLAQEGAPSLHDGIGSGSPMGLAPMWDLQVEL